MYFVSALKAPPSLFLDSTTKRWRRIRRICPQLLDPDFGHSDLFLLSLSVGLQGRHPCFRSRDPADELLVLLLCPRHFLTQSSRIGMLRYHSETMDSFTLSHETVTKLNTDSKAQRTTVRRVTTRDPKGKQGRTTATKLTGQLVNETWCL